jgi:hypothetical protein
VERMREIMARKRGEHAAAGAGSMGRR